MNTATILCPNCGSEIALSEALAEQFRPENEGAARGRQDKMDLTYDYLAGDRFRSRVEATVEAFLALQSGLGRERAAMERIWKEREKQIERVLANIAGLYGEVRGHARRCRAAGGRARTGRRRGPDRGCPRRGTARQGKPNWAWTRRSMNVMIAEEKRSATASLGRPMQTLVAKYRVTTPLFMGAPAGTDAAELNLRGVKGAVRFWWRALNYARLLRDGKDMREAEGRLFGAAAEKERDWGGSRYKWRVEWEGGKEPARHARGGVLPASNAERRGMVYLAGQGLMEVGSMQQNRPWGRLARECFWQSRMPLLRIELRAPKSSFHNGTDWTVDACAIGDAMLLLGLLGGIGSRKSRGFGSLVLESVQIDGHEVAASALYDTPEQYRTALRSLFDSYEVMIATSLPGIPALSGLSKIWLLADEASTKVSVDQRGKPISAGTVPNDPLALLDHVGRQMVRYRANGRGGRTMLDEPAEKNFWGDHEFAKQRPSHAHLHPERIAFGMPEGYNGCPVTSVRPASQERRGSPFLIHIHQLAGGEYVAVAAMLPAKLTPNGNFGIVMPPAHRNQNPLARGAMPGFEQTRAWQVLEEFVTGQVGPAGVKSGTPYFNRQTRIWP